MPQVQIRPVVTADIPALMQIDHQGKSEYVWQMDRVIEDNQVSINFREVRLPRSVRVEYPHAIDWSGEKLLSQGGLLVAILENELAGYIRLDDRYIPQTAWVRDLAVGVDFRRQGVASVLMIAAHEWAQQRKIAPDDVRNAFEKLSGHTNGVKNWDLNSAVFMINIMQPGYCNFLQSGYSLVFLTTKDKLCLLY